MEITMKTLQEIKSMTLEYGAANSGIIDVNDIVFDPGLRKACEDNHCGKYGKNYTCPPHVGQIDQLIKQTKTYSKAIVYQLIGTIEDSFDWEGMQRISKDHEVLTRKIFNYCRENCDAFMVLGAGGCKYCEACSILEDEPCISPQNAIASLEAHCIFVTNLSTCSDMNYINVKNSVTYFGAIFLKS